MAGTSAYQIPPVVQGTLGSLPRLSGLIGWRMALTVRTDMITGPRVSRKSRTAEFDYQVQSDASGDGPTLAEAVETAVLGVAPANYRGWPIDDVVVGPERNSDRRFVVTVKYAASGGGGLQPETGDIAESWTTGGGTSHVKTSKETVATSAGAPTFHTAINVVDGKIEGVDIIEPAWSEQLTKYIPTSGIAAAKAAAFAATGTINDDEWRGFAEGEVLLVEVTGQKRSEGDWEVTYRFAAKPNVTGANIAGEFPGVDYGAWSVVWVLYQQTVVANHNVVGAIGYYEERVYEYSDFDALDLE